VYSNQVSVTSTSSVVGVQVSGLSRDTLADIGFITFIASIADVQRGAAGAIVGAF
jgi:hypothetical protein